MSVQLGSARIDENGHAYGGKAGDQTGKEVSRQAWYLHSKGWRVLRALSADFAEKIAAAMDAACDNRHIGYDQYQRDTLRTQTAALQPPYWPGTAATDCETDCSSLVRVCVAYAAGRDVIGEVLGGTRFSTANQVKYMLKTGLFAELTGADYTKSSKLLRRGDVLVTCTQGHTVVVLSDGSGTMKGTPNIPAPAGLKKGDRGAQVLEMQQLLLALGYALPRYGADGDFGSETLAAVKAFQQDHALNADGVCDENTLVTMKKAAEQAQVLRKGDKGAAVTEMQQLLLDLGYALPRYGADGDFGSETLAAVRAFQQDNALTADGVCDEKTLTTMKQLLAAKCGSSIRITGGSVNVREAEGTSAKVVGIVHTGDELRYTEVSASGWYHTEKGWVSGKYAQVIAPAKPTQEVTK